MKISFFKLAVLVFVLGAGLNYLEETRLQKSNQLRQIVLEAPSVKEIKHKKKRKYPKPQEKNEPVDTFRRNEIYIHGLGDYNEDDLQVIREGVEKFWGRTAMISEPFHSPSDFYFLEDGETLNGNNVLTLGEKNGLGYHIYVTNHPLTGNSEDRTVSGYAGTNKKTSVVTTHQVIEFGKYSEQKMINITNHELGHNFGLNHCDNQNCFMISKNIGNNDLCDNCKLKLNQ